MKIHILLKFGVAFAVSVLLRPVFLNDGEYVIACFISGIGLATVFGLIEGVKIEKK
jgi:hypothetical protein